MRYATVMLLGLVLGLLAIRWFKIKTAARVSVGDPVILDLNTVKAIENRGFILRGLEL